MTDPLHITFEVAVPQRHAFETWTTRFDSWWPHSHTVSGRSDALIELEPRIGGEIGERLPDGSHHTWGTVTTWDPPSEFGYDWHFGREAAKATQVRIRFVSLSQDRTQVEIQHAGWDGLGDEAATWRERNVGGWRSMLPHFLDQLERETR